MKYFLLLFLLTKFTPSHSQPAFYERTYGLGRGVSIHSAFNGNYVIGAHVGAYPHGTAYYFLINPDGDTIRSMSYGLSTLNCVRQTPDSGFVFIGDSCCSRNAGIYKTDSAGNVQWHTTYYPSEFGTWGSTVIPNSDGSYFLGYVDDGDGPENFYHVIKADSSGQTLSDTTVNESTGFLMNPGSIQPTSDGGVIAVATHFYSEGLYLTKLDADDSIEWVKIFVDTSYNLGFQSYSVIQTLDGGYLISGYQDSIVLNGGLPYLGMLIKTDANGDSTWCKYFYYPNTAMQFYCAVQNSVGEFYIAAEHRTVNPTAYSLILLKADINGDTLWSRSFSGYGGATPNAIILDSAENPMVLGLTEDTTSHQFYIYLIKTDTSGNIPLGNTQIDKDESEIIVFPNPVNSTLRVSCQKKNINEISFVLRSILGQSIFAKTEKNIYSGFIETIDMSFLPSSIYLLEINIDGSRTYKKIFKDSQ
jgi:hypothetical protein